MPKKKAIKNFYFTFFVSALIEIFHYSTPNSVVHVMLPRALIMILMLILCLRCCGKMPVLLARGCTIVSKLNVFAVLLMKNNNNWPQQKSAKSEKTITILDECSTWIFLSNITCKSTAHKLTRAFSLKTRNILLYFFEDFVRAANGAKLHFWIERNITLYACSRISKKYSWFNATHYIHCTKKMFQIQVK